jgi:hypothetical protein
MRREKASAVRVHSDEIELPLCPLQNHWFPKDQWIGGSSG